MVRELEKLSAYELLQFALVALNESEELFFLWQKWAYLHYLQKLQWQQLLIKNVNTYLRMIKFSIN